MTDQPVYGPRLPTLDEAEEAYREANAAWTAREFAERAAAFEATEVLAVRATMRSEPEAGL